MLRGSVSRLFWKFECLCLTSRLIDCLDVSLVFDEDGRETFIEVEVNVAEEAT